MDNSHIKSYLILLALWNGATYLTLPLVYILPVALIAQIIIGIACGKFIAKYSYIHMFLLTTIVTPINIMAPFIPDPTNGLVLVYCWYSSAIYILGLFIWGVYRKIKSLTIHSSTPAKSAGLDRPNSGRPLN